MWQNQLKAKLQQQHHAFGPFLRIPGPIGAELAARAGFDFVVIDQEHGAIDLRDAEGMILAARAAGVTPVVRLEAAGAPLIHRILDLGAEGVMLPQVSGASEAQAVAGATRYLPEGTRGLGGPTRGDNWGALPLRESMDRLNREVLSIAQIESTGALAELDQIAATPGLDILFVGPMDLSQALGLPGQTDHPVVVEAIERVAAACQAHGKIAGIFAGTPAAARFWQERGFRMIATGLDSLLLGQALSTLRQALG